MPTKPPTALSVVARDPQGAEVRWDAHARDAGNRPQNLRFSTKRGEGFSEGDATLARRIDRDYIDLGLLNDVAIVGDDGDSAWEGRVAGRPGSYDQGGHSLAPALIGWMSHAKAHRFRQVYVDRDFASWTDAPLNRRVALAGTYEQGKIQLQIGQGIVWDLPNESIPNLAISEAWYTAPAGVTIAKLGYKGARSNYPATFHVARVYTDDNDSGSSVTSINITLDDTVRSVTFAPAERYLVIDSQNDSGGAVTPAAGAQQRISQIAAYGNHGLTTRPISGEPEGVYASDVIKHIAAAHAPLLSTAGVQDTTYPIRQVAFRDALFPFDAWQQLNNFHLWELAVWEDRTLYYAPADLSDYDWEIRLSDPGVKVSLQGDNVDDLVNGIEVTYDDLSTGRRETLTPTDYVELRDATAENPATLWGESRWASYDLPFPATSADALQFGRIKLAELLQPKGAGSIEATGHVRDRAGHWQPAWKMRAGDTVAITDHPNDRPRMIVETNYDDPTRTIRVAVDSTFQTLDAIADRIQTALAAANVGR